VSLSLSGLPLMYAAVSRRWPRGHRTGVVSPMGSASSGAAPGEAGSATSVEQARHLVWVLRLVYLVGTLCVRSWCSIHRCVGPGDVSTTPGPLHVLRP
jgi:hypothetical protein